jgi:hypothetical protein
VGLPIYIIVEFGHALGILKKPLMRRRINEGDSKLLLRP